MLSLRCFIRELRIMDLEVDLKFSELVKELEASSGEAIDLQAIIYMIGLQELGFGYRKYSKDEKLQVMHVGVCALLEPSGYYVFEGRDEDGWPHYAAKQKLPPLSDKEQQQLMKRAVLDYFGH